MRLVHLDLKGAAPRVSYLEQVFPLLSQLGANGVLIEYEDMFPFKGELEILRSPYAYSEEDIERIQQLAEQHKLEVVPLVQTFGHVEVEAASPAPHPGSQGFPWTPPDGSSPQFILKHEKYQHLREVERFPNSFNPHVPDTLALLKSLLSQVIEKHRRSTWIHIGADEVFHLGEGTDSRNWMSRHKGDVGTMYLKHIKEVLGFLTAQYWGLRVLMWDDMLRKISVGALRGEGTGWHLCQAPQPHPLCAHPGGHPVPAGAHALPWGNVALGAVASCSPAGRGKGSWEPLCPPGAHRAVLARCWLSLSLSLSLSHRYDHYSVLCELLPVSIPSLAICLQTLVNGGFTEEAKRKVLDVLGLESVQLEQSTCEGRGAFPGAEIYHMVEQVNGHLKESILKALEEESAIKGWFSPYHRKRQFGNPRNMESFGSKVLKLHEDWESFVRDLRAQLERIYFPDTVEEWLEENVNPYLDQLRDLVRDYR
ncbi:HEXDC Hexosaminidase, partial [Calcarius ornatus]|nr:HEXDC Hexosaminidase [Calcarius ornatus]